MATILTLTANTLIDCLTTGPVRVGKVNRVERFDLAAGGKGLNVGRLLVTLGHKVIAAGFAGGWSGRLLEGIVREAGMDPLLITTRARTRIGFNVQGHEGNIAFLENGFAVDPAEVSTLVDAVTARLGVVQLVLVSGSVPDPSCADLYSRILDRCADAGVPCWLDAYGPAMEKALANPKRPQLAKANKDEFQGGDGWNHCPEVHVTDGPHEILVRTPEAEFAVRPPRLEERSSIASGDCYFAGLAHARLSGMDVEDQLRFAAAAGAANAALGATGRIGLDHIKEWLERVAVARVD